MGCLPALWPLGRQGCCTWRRCRAPPPRGAPASSLRVRLVPAGTTQVNYLPTKLFGAERVLLERAHVCVALPLPPHCTCTSAPCCFAGTPWGRKGWLPAALPTAAQRAQHTGAPSRHPLPLPRCRSERKREERALSGGFYSFAFLVGAQLWMPPLVTQLAGAPGGEGLPCGTARGDERPLIHALPLPLPHIPPSNPCPAAMVYRGDVALTASQVFASLGCARQGQARA